MRKLFFTLWIAGIVGTIAILPYLLTLRSEVLQTGPIPAQVALFLSVVQSAVILAAAVHIGLRAARSVGLRMPYLEYWLYGTKPQESYKKVAKISVIWGIVVGVVIYLADVVFLSMSTLNDIQGDTVIPFWQRLLVPLYGGITEELFLRLFFMSILVWISAKIFSQKNPTQNKFLMWSSITVAAIVFGIGHLPAMSQVVTLTSFIIIRTILLNAVGGLVFGYLYWKKGFEAAVIAHATADVVLHIIIAPLL